MESYQITRLEMHKKIMEMKGKSFYDKKLHLLDFLSRSLNLEEHIEVRESLHEFLRWFLMHYQKRWEESHRKNERFLARNNAWLKEQIIFPDAIHQYLPSTSSPTGSVGRPKKDFSTSSDRSKRRKVQSIRSSSSAAELALAASLSLKEEGDSAAAELITEITTSTPTRAKRVMTKWRKREETHSEMSPEDALSLIITTELTKNQYNSIRSTALSYGHNLCPSYARVLNAKQAAYPEEIRITESKCEVRLQDLLNHTASRILSCVSTALPSSNEANCTLICKYGFDGSSGHAQYKQMWEEATSSDEYLFMSSMVPLRLLNDSTGEIIWKNPRPSSTRFCRPIRLQWLKETKEVAKTEKKYIQSQIDALDNWKWGNYSVHFNLVLTMIDGKVCNALTETGTMRCYICGAKSSQMNDLKAIKDLPVDETKYSFGLSTLHCYIRFFECILHISYRLEFQQWQARGNLKIQLKNKKISIQKAFRERMGLIVDVPRPGSGNTNDGNTARRFFDTPELAADITGVNIDLISKFAIILRAISCGISLKYTAFSQYCQRTAELYVELYPWYYMPTTVHKVLMHGGEIAKEAILPLGQLSEEALEARNKDTRKFRQRFTRKHSRVATNHDIFQRLLITSDPYISSTVNSKPKVSRKMPKELRELLVLEESDGEESDCSNGQDSSED